MLYSYKMTHDSGFAPNPFHGVLTLATCKPKIRETKQVGMYVAGFTSKELCGDPVGHERLLYIMRIGKILTYDEYYRSHEFRNKIPSDNTDINEVGDNIYYLKNGTYKNIVSNHHYTKEQIDRDLTSKKVLIADEYFYFGRAAIPIDRFRINIPRTQTAYGIGTYDTAAIAALWNYLEKNFKKNTLIAPPHDWKSDELVECKSVCVK